MSALSDEFARLADAATPGPWVCIADNYDGEGPFAMGPEGGEIVTEDLGGVVTCSDPYPRGDNHPNEAMEFIALCGTHRAEIERRLRISDVVLSRTKAEALRISNAYNSLLRRFPDENVESACRAIIAIADEGKP